MDMEEFLYELKTTGIRTEISEEWNFIKMKPSPTEE